MEIAQGWKDWLARELHRAETQAEAEKIRGVQIGEFRNGSAKIKLPGDVIPYLLALVERDGGKAEAITNVRVTCACRIEEGRGC